MPRGVSGGHERAPRAVRGGGGLAPQSRYRETSAAAKDGVVVTAACVVFVLDGVRIEGGDEGAGVRVEHLDDAGEEASH